MLTLSAFISAYAAPRLNVFQYILYFPYIQHRNWQKLLKLTQSCIRWATKQVYYAINLQI